VELEGLEPKPGFESRIQPWSLFSTSQVSNGLRYFADEYWVLQEEISNGFHRFYYMTEGQNWVLFRDTEQEAFKEREDRMRAVAQLEQVVEYTMLGASFFINPVGAGELILARAFVPIVKHGGKAIRYAGKALKYAWQKGSQALNWAKTIARKPGMVDDAVGVGVLTKNEHQAIRSLERNIREHEEKLSEYTKNPDAFDNKGHLANAGTNLQRREKIINSCIDHLSDEIRESKNQIDKIKNK
jgi:hypothetical protein